MKRAILLMVVVLAALFVASCGGGGSGGGGGGGNPTTYTLTVSKTGSGSGTVTSSDGNINCGSSCNATYNSGTTVTLTAANTSTSAFIGWSGACSGTTLACTLTMTSNLSTTATFNTLVVSVTPTTASVLVNATQQFVAKDQSGTVVAVNWSVNNVSGGNSTVGTINISGLYTAPAAVPSSNPVTVQGCSTANSSLCGTASVTITAPPPPPPFLAYWRNGPSTTCGGLCQDIWKVYLDTNGLAIGSPIRLTTDGGSLMPSVSPDGTKIAFISGTGISAIFVMNADGSGQAQIPNGISYALFPAWSPDGTKIAFVGKLGDTVGIMTMNVDGSDTVQLTQDASCPSGGSCKIPGRPTWSPDGKRIAYGKPDGTTTIIDSTNGSNPFTLPTPNPSDYLAWSPDGTLISFSTFQSNNFALCLIHPDGTGLVNLAIAGLNPTWSPDSSRIIFQNSVDGKIYVIKVDGTGLTLVVGDTVSTSGEPSWWGPH